MMMPIELEIHVNIGNILANTRDIYEKHFRGKRKVKYEKVLSLIDLVRHNISSTRRQINTTYQPDSAAYKSYQQILSTALEVLNHLESAVVILQKLKNRQIQDNENTRSQYLELMDNFYDFYNVLMSLARDFVEHAPLIEGIH